MNKVRVALWQNSMAKTFRNVKVFAGDNYYLPAQAEIKNFIVLPAKELTRKDGPVGPGKVILKCKVLQGISKI